MQIFTIINNYIKLLLLLNFQLLNTTPLTFKLKLIFLPQRIILNIIKRKLHFAIFYR